MTTVIRLTDTHRFAEMVAKCLRQPWSQITDVGHVDKVTPCRASFVVMDGIGQQAYTVTIEPTR